MDEPTMNALPDAALIEKVLTRVSSSNTGKDRSLSDYYFAIVRIDPDGAPDAWIHWLNTIVPLAPVVEKDVNAWAWHDLLVYAVESDEPHRSRWGIALLDHGVESMLYRAKNAWGGGQALRSALSLPGTSSALIERLWNQMVDPQPILDVLLHRIARKDGDNRYTSIADQVLTRLASEGRNLDLVQTCADTIGMTHLPAFEHWRQSQARLQMLDEVTPVAPAFKKSRPRS